MPIVSIYSNNGGEYEALKLVFSQHDITHFTTPPHTPEHNGLAERHHINVVETTLQLGMT